jgi:hypothetical protein
VSLVLALALVTGALAFKPVGPATGLRLSVTGAEGDTMRSALDPAPAYNPKRGEYLVAFEADPLAVEGEIEIFAQRVSRRGALRGARVRVSNMGLDSDDSHDGTDPSIAFNSRLKQFLVVWEGDGQANPNEDEIYGQRLGAKGAPIGGDFRISTVGADGDAARDGTDADVAYNSRRNQYLVVWEGDDQANPGEDEIHAQRLSATGGELGGDFKVSTTLPDGDIARDAVDAEVAYNSRRNQYLVVWEADALATEGELEIFGQRLGAGGGELGGDFRISTTGMDTDALRGAEDPDVAYNSRRNQYLVAWAADGLPTDNDHEIFVQRLTTAGGQLGGDTRISTTGIEGDTDPLVQAARIAFAARQNEYLVIWSGDGPFAPGEFELFGQRLRGGGGQLDDDIRLSVTGADGDIFRTIGTPPGVAAGSGQYLVGWDGDSLAANDDFEVFVRRLVVPRCFGKVPTLVGTEGADVLTGTRRRDVIVGLGGPDRLIGRGGNDLLCGNAGNDRLRSGPGLDRTKQ